MVSYEEILGKEPKILVEWLIKNFYIDIPCEINSVEDMSDASKALLKLSSSYSYLCNLASYAKIMCRNAKREKDKLVYEDMVDKKEIIAFITDGIHQSYQALSRAVTIYMHNMEELKMLNK